MRRSLYTAAMILLANPSGSLAQVDVATLAEAYKMHDMSLNEGKGHSESTDSGTLGWGEGAVIQTYAQMWEATEDPYWLTKIGAHFQRIMENASDPDGDGYLSWSTKTYSCAVAQHNAYRWHDWDWIEYGQPGHSGYEDTSHAALSMSLAVEAARRGVIFADEDMKRIANTWLKVMWNQHQEKPMMAAAADGRAPHRFSPLMPRWTELSEWGRTVYDLARKAFLAQSPAQQARSAPVMLLRAKRAGVELD